MKKLGIHANMTNEVVEIARRLIEMNAGYAEWQRESVDPDNTMLRVRFLEDSADTASNKKIVRNETKLTEQLFERILLSREKIRARNRERTRIMETLQAVGTDMVIRMSRAKDVDELMDAYRSLSAIRTYCNGELAKLERYFRTGTIEVEPLWSTRKPVPSSTTATAESTTATAEGGADLS
jgi:hypothetical protein